MNIERAKKKVAATRKKVWRELERNGHRLIPRGVRPSILGVYFRYGCHRCQGVLELVVNEDPGVRKILSDELKRSCRTFTAAELEERLPFVSTVADARGAAK